MVEGILVISWQDYTRQQIQHVIKYPGKLLIPYQSFQAVAISFLPTECPPCSQQACFIMTLNKADQYTYCSSLRWFQFATLELRRGLGHRNCFWNHYCGHSSPRTEKFFTRVNLARFPSQFYSGEWHPSLCESTSSLMI